MAQLRAQECRLQSIETGIHAPHVVQIFIGAPMIGALDDTGDKSGVLAEVRAAVAPGAEILSGIEAEGRRRAQITRPYAIAYCPVRLRRILDDREAMAVGDGADRPHVRHLAVEM